MAAKKRIGILTLPLNNNFGGLLQSYALQKYLNENGNDAILIDRRHNQSNFNWVKVLLKKYFFKKKYIQFVENNITISVNTKKFRDKYISPKTEEIFSEKSLNKIVKDNQFDAVIVGSDQVWRLEYATDLTHNMFLDFITKSKTKKVSYAASFGVGSWEHGNETTHVIKNLIRKFDYVSVREDSGVKICKEIFDTDAKQHIDPTMLLTPEDYIDLVAKENEPKRKGTILTYMLDNSEERKFLVNKIQEEIKGKVFNINVKSKKITDPIEDRIFPTVTSWLRGFIDAEFAIVDSFHGCVFSILFNKPFIAFGNKKRGLTRFTSLLKLFDLEDRLIVDPKDLTKEIICSEIDWEKTNKILENCRVDSENFLKNI